MKKTMKQEIQDGINQLLASSSSAQVPSLELIHATSPALASLEENNYVVRLPRSKWLKSVISKENSRE